MHKEKTNTVIFDNVYIQFLDLSGCSDGKESTCSAEDLGLIPRLGKSPGEGNGYPPQYSCLENSMG